LFFSLVSGHTGLLNDAAAGAAVKEAAFHAFVASERAFNSDFRVLSWSSISEFLARRMDRYTVQIFAGTETLR
jgi:hypothetical protein